MKKMIAAAMATLMLLMAGCSGGGDGGAASSGSASSGGSQSNYPNGPVQIVLPAKPGGDVTPADACSPRTWRSIWAPPWSP